MEIYFKDIGTPQWDTLTLLTWIMISLSYKFESSQGHLQESKGKGSGK